MNHIVDMCSLTKFDSGLQLLNEMEASMHSSLLDYLFITEISIYESEHSTNLWNG